MSLLAANSLEHYCRNWLGCFSAIIAVLSAALIWQNSHILWLAIAVFCALFLLGLLLSSRISHRVLQGYLRIGLHLDAIKEQDYNQLTKVSFKAGINADIVQQLNQLSQQLHQQKSRYDQHIFLIYQLISQLQTPILVFNQKQQLVHANEAFYQLYGQHWQIQRFATAEALGLQQSPNWQFSDADKNRHWQISSSEFINDGNAHQLLIFIDIRAALRANQISAWRQLIKVMSHEIRNSLAPVASMAERLADKTQAERDLAALNLIQNRCEHLQQFVSRFAAMSDELKINPQSFALMPMLQDIKLVQPGLSFDFDIQPEQLYADKMLVEQLLINLIKNAAEAGANKVIIKAELQGKQQVLSLMDNGQGIANPENLFVPLYSTKRDGQGIGLNLCRQIAEAHGGTLTLQNHSQQGAVATLTLPVAE
ncbi:sensor histidine kinase [Neptunicella marina]|uniref:histidine kinase n=1 Tax=Neptunicella marina TaxID=2125989 RepID=A0A8J6IU86_9ALTE|nr:HAMP domain-containing sensor histidine kinase [Neptunicella marina]MBC3765723.1 HAMP domain-containing histidine kinase [Neptunicella marina]